MFRTVIYVAFAAAASAFAPPLGSGCITSRQSLRAISHAGHLRMQASDADAGAADDGAQPVATGGTQYATPGPVNRGLFEVFPTSAKSVGCPLSTADAADELTRRRLGGLNSHSQRSRGVLSHDSSPKQHNEG